MLGFALSIPLFFATTYAWVLWLAVPLVTGQVRRLRAGNAGDSAD